MKKRVLYGLLFVVLGLNLYIGAEIYFASAQAAEKNNLYQQMDIFVRVMEKVRQEYVDGDKVSYDELMRGALKGMLGTLDPHSEFMEPAKHEDLKNDTEGSFGGVGLIVGPLAVALFIAVASRPAPEERETAAAPASAETAADAPH